jgi:WD40 repeat protein
MSATDTASTRPEMPSDEPVLAVSGPAEPTWTLTLADHVSAAVWSPDGTALAAGSLAGEAVIADAATGNSTPLSPHPLGVLSLAWSSGSGRVAVGGQDARLALYERSGRPLCDLGLGAWVSALAWAPDGRYLAAAAGRSVVVTDPDGAVVHSYPEHPSTVTSLVWDARGRRVAAAFYGGVRWYEPGRAQSTAVDQLKWKGSILALAASPDRRWLAAGNQDRSVQLWRLGKDRHLEMPGYPAKIDQLAFDPTSRYLAVGSVGFTTVWDCAGRGPEGSTPRLLEGHVRRVTALAWQHQGEGLVTADADGLVAWWDPARSGRPRQVLDVGEEVTTASFRLDDEALLVTTARGRVLSLPATR